MCIIGYNSVTQLCVFHLVPLQDGFLLSYTPLPRVTFWKTFEPDWCTEFLDILSLLKAVEICTSNLLLIFITNKKSGIVLNTGSAASHSASSGTKGCFFYWTSSWVLLLSVSSPVGFVAAGVRLQSEPHSEEPGVHHTEVQHLFWKSCSTTEESASVEISPRSRSLQAILRSTRRMILPAECWGSGFK